jgi:hypothetical protein
MTIEGNVSKLRQLQAKISKDSRVGTILLVDLVDSTRFKTTNPEDVWVSRLFLFRETVARCLPTVPRKYLGDGILCFGENSKVPPGEFMKAAEAILKAIDKANADFNCRGDHALQVRIVIGFGSVHLFDKTDPQGEAVDKVFRCEKYVPSSCVGITEDIENLGLNLKTTPIGGFRLKGLGEKRHKLFLLNTGKPPINKTLAQLRKSAALQEFWDLGAHNDGRIYVVSGHIPSDDGAEQETLQLGDKDAIVGVVVNLAAVGRSDDITPLTSDKATPYLGENIVSIGGPYWNSVSQAFLKEVQSPFVFEWDPEDETPITYCCKTSGKIFRARKVGGKLRQDYGFLGRFKNPRNPDRHVILVCGIETPAVAGLIGVFGRDNPNLLNLHEAILSKATPEERAVGALPDFFCLIKFSVDSCAAVPPTSEEQKALIITDWMKDHTGLLQRDPPS